MLHPDTRLVTIDEQVGYGVVATRTIPAGTVTWVRDPLDQELEPELTDGMEPRWRALVERYSYVTGRGTRLLCWDHTRFMNHSCEANCFALGPDTEIAVRDIGAGEQLTNDYSTLNLEGPFVCLCGSPACRGTVRPDDLEGFAAGWDRAVAMAVWQARSQEQPLASFHPDWGSVERWCDRPRSVPSLLQRRCRPRVHPGRSRVAGGLRRDLPH